MWCMYVHVYYLHSVLCFMSVRIICGDFDYLIHILNVSFKI